MKASEGVAVAGIFADPSAERRATVWICTQSTRSCWLAKWIFISFVWNVIFKLIYSKKYLKIIPVRISADYLSGRKNGICTCIRLLLKCSVKRKLESLSVLVGSCRWPSDGSFPHERIANQAANQPVYHQMMVSNGKSSCHSVRLDPKSFLSWLEQLIRVSRIFNLKRSDWERFHSFNICGMLFNGSLKVLRLKENLQVTWKNVDANDWPRAKLIEFHRGISFRLFIHRPLSIDGISLKLKGFWTFPLDLVAYLAEDFQISSKLFTWAKVWATDRPNRWTSTAPVTEPPACDSRDREQVKTSDLKRFRDRWRPCWVRGGGARAASSGNRRPSVAGRCCWAEAAAEAAEGGAAADCDSADGRAAPHRLFPLVARIILFKSNEIY